MLLLTILQETVRGAVHSPIQIGLEETINSLVLWLKLVVELSSVIVIGVGVGVTIVRLVMTLSKKRRNDYAATRLTLARFLALGLELQLAADIVATAVAPSWNQVGKLGAIAVIRTGLNYFLARELKGGQEVGAKLKTASTETVEA